MAGFNGLLKDTDQPDVHEDVKSASRIFNLYGEFIRSVIQFQLTDKSRVDDLYQEFFISLIAHPIPPDLENIKSYLYKAVCRDVIDSGRRDKRHKEHYKKYRENFKSLINNQRPEYAITKKEHFNKLADTIYANLPEREAQAVYLRYHDEKDLDQVAFFMGVDKRTVSRYVSIGLKKLRKTLNKRELDTW